MKTFQLCDLPMPGADLHVMRVWDTLTWQSSAMYSVPFSPYVTTSMAFRLALPKFAPVMFTTSPPRVSAMSAPGPSKVVTVGHW